MREKQFMAQVVQLAKYLGWDLYHPYDSRRSRQGYPDLTLWKGRVLWAELKVPPNRLTRQQVRVIAGLRAAGAEVHVWTPKDWPAIETVLGVSRCRS